MPSFDLPSFLDPYQSRFRKYRHGHLVLLFTSRQWATKTQVQHFFVFLVRIIQTAYGWDQNLAWQVSLRIIHVGALYTGIYGSLSSFWSTSYGKALLMHIWLAYELPMFSFYSIIWEMVWPCVVVSLILQISIRWRKIKTMEWQLYFGVEF